MEIYQFARIKMILFEVIFWELFLVSSLQSMCLVSKIHKFENPTLKF